MNELDIKEKLKIALASKDMSIPDDKVLNLEIANAKSAINIQRRVAYNTVIPVEYSSIWIELCIEAISKYGAEGEISHNENGISRGYDNSSPYSLATLNRIIPRIGV